MGNNNIGAAHDRAARQILAAAGLEVTESTYSKPSRSSAARVGMAALGHPVTSAEDAEVRWPTTWNVTLRVLGAGMGAS
jgi:hypothetical protein